MKVIDLLNKIANGEEVPNKIKYDGELYELSKLGYYNTYSGADLLRKIMLDSFYLLKEIEIIEEDKKIEPLECYVNAILTGCISKYYEEDFEKSVKHNIDVLGTKINEIIDKINELEVK